MLRVRLDRRTRIHPGPSGALVVGGSPLRAVRLSATGAAAVQRWRAGGAPDGPVELALARRLHGAGVLHLEAPARWGPQDVTVVVPVRDRPAELQRCLRALRGLRVVVVDDGSQPPVRAPGATVLRSARSRGPAAARNTGLAAVRTPLVAFVDSDVVVPPGWLTGLLPELQPGTAVVAPRVVGAGGPGLLARYEQGSGPLDLGRESGPVRRRGRTGHVPAAVLLAERDALGEGFDEALRVGEDVALVWRLDDAGLGVRYAPQVRVAHGTRPDLRGWWRQRAGYGSSAALLDARAPVPPAVVPLRLVPAALLLAAGRPRPAALAALLATAHSADRLRRSLPAAPGRRREALRLAGEGTAAVAAGLADATARAWSPVLLPLLVAVPRARRTVLAGLAVHLVREVRTRPPSVALPVWAGLHLLDDLAYAAGLWGGALRHRRPRVLLPARD